MNRENRIIGAALAAAMSFASAFQAAANDTPALPPMAATLSFGTDAVDMRDQMSGFRQYCVTYAGACEELEKARADTVITLDAQNWAQLRAIHSRVFKSMDVVQDFLKYPLRTGIDAHLSPDVWTRGEDNKGDCEDYVLRWEDEFLKAGFPHSALLKMLVKTEALEYLRFPGTGVHFRKKIRSTKFQTFKQAHMILALRTDRGVFLADMDHSHLVPLENLDKKWAISRVESPKRAIDWVSATVTREETITADKVQDRAPQPRVASATGARPN